MMMSGNDCWNKNVFSHWRKVAIDGDDWTWTGKVFQTVALFDTVMASQIQ